MYDPRDFRIQPDVPHPSADVLISSRLPGRAPETMRISDLIGRRVQVRSTRSGSTYDLEIWGITSTEESPNSRSPIVILRTRKHGGPDTVFIEFNFDPRFHEVISEPQLIRNESDLRLESFKLLLRNCAL